MKFINGEPPEGAVEIHLYDIENILKPRGGEMQKESLSAYVADKLDGLFESWTNPKYGDSVDKQELSKILWRNLNEEVNLAWKNFMKKHMIKKI